MKNFQTQMSCAEFYVNRKIHAESAEGNSLSPLRKAQLSVHETHGHLINSVIMTSSLFLQVTLKCTKYRRPFRLHRHVKLNFHCSRFEDSHNCSNALYTITRLSNCDCLYTIATVYILLRLFIYYCDCLYTIATVYIVL
jgi:hypothetical protein